MSQNKNDGGPAFPVPEQFSYDGMTLRDWFAGQVMATLGNTNPSLPDSPASPSLWPEPPDLMQRRAAWAYLQADAMLAERSKP